jgi:hypothetical protein
VAPEGALRTATNLRLPALFYLLPQIRGERSLIGRISKAYVAGRAASDSSSPEMASSAQTSTTRAGFIPLVREPGAAPVTSPSETGLTP